MNPVLARLPILVLEPHSRCNCRCLMCDIWKRTDAQEITADQLAGHLDDIVRLGVEWVVFTGGEPLMHSDLFRLAGLLRQHGIRITILSTGLLLSRDAARIVRSTDEVIVSLDGPREIHDVIRGVTGAFNRMSEGVRALREASPSYPVSARCTVQARNASRLRATVSAARAMGLRSISFLAADLSSTAFNRLIEWPHQRKAGVAPGLEALEREMESLIAEYPTDGFILESPEKLCRIVSSFRAHYGLEPPTAPRCNAPWVSAVLEANGDVRPCFFQLPIGNTCAATLAQVLNSPAAISFRRNLDIATDPICRRCVCSLYLETPLAETQIAS